VAAGFANRVVDCATDGALNGLNNGAACCQLLMRQLMDWQNGVACWRVTSEVAGRTAYGDERAADCGS
jgi:hypothetical protein